jgi:two-component system, OmpR family, response regulator
MGAATIVFARGDFSIPGATELPQGEDGGVPDTESHFFKLLSDSNPDVIVLDLTRFRSLGIATILRIRQQSQVPILAVCDLRHSSAREFRIAGAAECVGTPIDILELNERLQQIIRITRRGSRQRSGSPEAFSFAGFTFYPHRDVLAATNGATLTLTTSESRLLLHFVSHPQRLCPRAEIVGVLYGGGRAAGDRAIDIVVNRLRHKLVVLRGAAGRTLIKTEFRRGYVLVAAVSTADESHETGTAA